MADNRSVDHEVQQETDLLILEYLIYNATAALLDYANQRLEVELGLCHPEDWFDESSEEKEHVMELLRLVESFLAIFKSGRDSSVVPRKISFRLQLLQFTALFTGHRPETITIPSESIKLLRTIHSTRAEQWRRGMGPAAFDERILQCDRKVFATEGIMSVAGVLHEHTQVLDWLDLLPLFVDLTAARAGVDADDDQDGAPSAVPEWATKPQWLELVAMMMFEATLGLCEDFPGSLEALVLEAFAWGPFPSTSSQQQQEASKIHASKGVTPSKSWEIADSDPDATSSLEHLPPLKQEQKYDTLFTLKSEDSSSPSKLPGTAWYKIRNRHLSRIFPFLDQKSPPKDEDDKLRVYNFEIKMFQFLSALHAGLEAPLLVQLERVKFDDLMNDTNDTSVTLDGAGLKVDLVRKLRRWVVAS